MSRKEYLEFLQDESKDMMELYYEYYKIKSGSLAFVDFVNYFSIWLFQVVGIKNLPYLQYFVFKKLNEHFSVY